MGDNREAEDRFKYHETYKSGLWGIIINHLFTIDKEPPWCYLDFGITSQKISEGHPPI